ncbi:MAG: TolC family protein [Phycisphaerales bacterium]|nr:TolC family protein [Chloroflexota bacterium]MBY0307544.1 TolC family protein [Phycisphaerales bacterium]
MTLRPAYTFAPSALLIALLVGAVGGCASLDAGPDVARASATIAERAGVATGWDAPWPRELEEWDGASPLSMERAVVLALKNNREIRREVELIAANRADLVQAGLLPNPVLAMALRFPIDPVKGYSQAGASVVQELVALWLRPQRIRSSEARLNEAVLTLSDRALRLVADVKQSHASIVFLQRAADLTRQSLATVDRSIGVLQRRIQGGEGTNLDVNRARQQRLVLEADLKRQERDLAKQKRVLLQLVGFAAIRADWTAADSAPAGETEHEPVLPALLEEAAVISLAGEQRLDVAAARAVVEANAANLRIEELSRVRNLALDASFEETEDRGRYLGPQVEVGIPIFDFNQAQISKAGSFARASLINYEATVQRAVAQARGAYVEARASADIADLYRHQVLTLAEDNLRLAESTLKSGKDDVTVLLTAQQAVVEARQALNGLRLDAALARIELEYAVGGRLAPPTASPVTPAEGPAAAKPGSTP